jgi:hypothetical protein
MLWGILVFGELQGKSHATFVQVIGGSLLMILGVAAIAASSVTRKEQVRWKEAALRESERYNVPLDYVETRFEGRQAPSEIHPRRTLVDWLLVTLATSILVWFATIARVPNLPIRWEPALELTIVSVLLLILGGRKLWRTTRFH